MKKSDFIEKVLKYEKNTVFVNKDQVEIVLEVFEDLGMLPPLTDNLANENGKGFGWESENES